MARQGGLTRQGVRDLDATRPREQRNRLPRVCGTSQMPHRWEWRGSRASSRMEDGADLYVCAYCNAREERP